MFDGRNQSSTGWVCSAETYGSGGMATFAPLQATKSWTPSNEFEKVAVQQQVELLLASPLFHASKRYPSFLRFVVARALSGQTDQLKERILGVEIFDRPADYDTNTDPIVRVTAAEIRKRIEHYYQDHKHKHEIRMILPAGSYAPQFYWPGHPSAPPETSLALPSDASDALNAQPVVTLPDVPRSEPTFLARRKPALAVVTLTLV